VRDAGPDNGLTHSRPLRIKTGDGKIWEQQTYTQLGRRAAKGWKRGCTLCRADSDVGGRSPARYKCHVRRSWGHRSSLADYTK